MRRNEESRNQQSKYIKPQPGDKIVLLFDAEKIEPVGMEFDGKKTTRYQYTVTDPNDPNQSEKYITFGKRNSAQVDTLLSEGHSILKVHRIGAGKVHVAFSDSNFPAVYQKNVLDIYALSSTPESLYRRIKYTLAQDAFGIGDFVIDLTVSSDEGVIQLKRLTLHVDRDNTKLDFVG